MIRLGQSGYCCSGGNIKQDLRRAQSSGAENKQTSVFGLECCEACARIRCFKCIFRRNRSTNIRLYSVGERRFTTSYRTVGLFLAD